MRVQVCVRQLLENLSFADVHTYFVIWSSRLEETIFAKTLYSILFCIIKRCWMGMFQAGHDREVRQYLASDNTPTHKFWSQKFKWCKKCWPDRARGNLNPQDDLDGEVTQIHRHVHYWITAATIITDLAGKIKFHKHTCTQKMIPREILPHQNSKTPDKKTSVNTDLKNKILTFCLIFSYMKIGAAASKFPI